MVVRPTRRVARSGIINARAFCGEYAARGAVVPDQKARRAPQRPPRWRAGVPDDAVVAPGTRGRHGRARRHRGSGRSSSRRRDRPTPPPLDDADRLLRDGATAVAIAAAYLLPGVLVLGPLVYARAVGADLPTLYTAAGLSEGLANAAVSATGFVAIVAVMSLIGALYATPVAVTRFAREDRVAAAFEGRRVVAGALTEDYAVAWAIALLVQVVLFPIALALRAALVGFFLQFVVAVGVRYCYARGVGHGLDLDPVAPATEERTRGQDTSGDTRGSPNSDAGEDTADGPDPTTVGTAAEMDDGGAAETNLESEGSGDAPTGTDDASTMDDFEGERT
ncbi:hypothetical protein BRD11_01910 [Halobacteriales archaeon SW_12_69_24]|nr:MAG: hypothetical protein BRD11_01910 [Halobacteriales archaeon SW_12_69_24]